METWLNIKIDITESNMCEQEMDGPVSESRVIVDFSTSVIKPSICVAWIFKLLQPGKPMNYEDRMQLREQWANADSALPSLNCRISRNTSRRPINLNVYTT